MIEPEVQAHMESDAERRRCIDAVPDWLRHCLYRSFWGRRHYRAPYVSPPTPGLRYRVDVDFCGTTWTAERKLDGGDWQEVRRWTSIEPEPLDVCEAIVEDWERIRVTPGWDIGSVSVTDEPYRDTDQREQLMAEAAEIVSLVCRKGAAYGDSYKARTGQLRDTLFENAIRINDKASRLYTLTRAASLGRTIDHGDEAVRDTLRDLAGYALLLLAECAGEAEEATE